MKEAPSKERQKTKDSKGSKDNLLKDKKNTEAKIKSNLHLLDKLDKLLPKKDKIQDLKEKIDKILEQNYLRKNKETEKLTNTNSKPTLEKQVEKRKEMKKKELMLDEKLINIPISAKEKGKTAKNAEYLEKMSKLTNGNKFEVKLSSRLK